jgi:hypothetical protein
MYAFLFVLVPLATVAAWALVRDRKRLHQRHRRHAHAPSIQSRIRTARESAQERAAKWMLRASLTMAGRPHRCLCRCLAKRDLPRARGETGSAALSSCGERGGPRWAAGSGWSR